MMFGRIAESVYTDQQQLQKAEQRNNYRGGAKKSSRLQVGTLDFRDVSMDFYCDSHQWPIALLQTEGPSRTGMCGCEKVVFGAQSKGAPFCLTSAVFVSGTNVFSSISAPVIEIEQFAALVFCITGLVLVIAVTALVLTVRRHRSRSDEEVRRQQPH
jgi:hypothetical protein